MKAAAALLKRGGVGSDKFCFRCDDCLANRKDVYVMKELDEDFSLQGLAESVGCFAADLWAINICGHEKDTSLRTEEGMMENTFEQLFKQRQTSTAIVKAVQVKSSPNKELFWKLQGWNLAEGDTRAPREHKKSSGCRCEVCKIPKGSWVRVFRNPGLQSSIIDGLWKIDVRYVISDPLHALMRITESILWALIATVHDPQLFEVSCGLISLTLHPSPPLLLQ